MNADRAWRAWSDRLLSENHVTTDLLAGLWREVLRFDDVLAGFAENRVPVPRGTVIVSGSGKETFKTFNVSTAAALLAAAAGVSVVKGTSPSVSAVSGSADVLSALGVPVLTSPADVTEAVERIGIAFVDYGSFCPRYAARYDGRFSELSPMSFFMPAASLLVDAEAFLHGLAHSDVGTAARAIRAARPELARGQVVTTDVGEGMVVDEIAPVGYTRTAEALGNGVTVSRRTRPGDRAAWRRSVAHRSDHASNALVLMEALRPDADPSLADFVDLNAAAIVACARPTITEDAALALVREARAAGGPNRLLQSLRQAADQRGTR
ncbi:hypothetical protein ACFWN1_04040 [Streptomyces sp. NPDC058459]|uniref:hypothetical protein n=1 Tax=Streptomyces sp. NPDC058459 TaxID=3346508 RepID=UPI0036606497